MSHVTVVIPCFNQGLYLEQALSSVFKQTYPDLDIVVVNDGSTDPETISILDSIRDTRVRIINQSNKGLSAARNAGIEISAGEFVLPLDSDDYIEPTFIEKCLEVFRVNADIRAVSSDVQCFGIFDCLRENSGGTLGEFLASCRVSSCALFRKSTWEEVSGYDELMLLGYEDWEFWIRVLSKGGRIHIVHEPLFNYRIKEASMVIQSNKNRYSIMQYIVQKHSTLFQKYAVEAIIGREELIMKNELQYENNIKGIIEGKTYKTGKFILAPVYWFKKIISR